MASEAPESMRSAASRMPSAIESALPARYNAAPALSSTTSRRGPVSPDNTARVIAAFSAGVPPASSAALQVSLFADSHPAVEALRTLDVNALTPLEALNRLYELQQLSERT